MAVSALFIATNAAGHTGLWIADGTVAGTVELSVRGAYARGLQPYDLTLLGAKILFDGADASGNFSPWATDGTPARYRCRRAARGLFVSPDHGLYVDGVLVPTNLLIDGTAVR